MLTLYFASVHVGGSAGNESAMEEKDNDAPRDLLAEPPRVVNIGLEIFAVNLASQDAKVAHVRWSPPAGGNSHLASLLEKLRGR
jgi:hypothetical protein